MAEKDLPRIFSALKRILRKHEKGLVSYDEFVNSQAKEQKPSYHLYGKPEVSIGGRKPQQTFVAGVVQQKYSVGFYHMPVYSHPQEFELSAALSKAKSGKSCFQIKHDDPSMYAELEGLLSAGIELYQQEGWI